MSTWRWLLTGHLTTTRPLHLGSGEPVRREGLTHPETGEPVDVNGVAVDHRGRAYLPGTALKGVLRRWCRASGAGEALVRDLFGSERPGGPARPGEADRAPAGPAYLGGAAEVWDAFVAVEPDLASEPAGWDPRRLTGVAARVAIDRVTGAAAHQRLFHDEMVPAGVRFAVTVAGCFTEEGAALVLAAFAAFDDPREPLVLGADSGNGWGRLSWSPGEIRRLDTEGMRRWVAAGGPAVGWAALEPVAEGERRRLLERAGELAAARPGGGRLTLSLTLRFEGPFLVNDPSRTGEGEELPDHAGLLDGEGRPYLPASSFRGALRSQAERILRTVAGEEAACGPGAPREPCRPPASTAGLAGLCPVCRLFGAAGWRSPVAVTDFGVGEEPGTSAGAPYRQELLAIDRFTGGGAPRLKFDAEGSFQPVLAGTLQVDLAALERAGGGTWALGLLALVLRDLAEGDITFGFGSGKGYGRCRAHLEAREVPGWQELPAALRAELEDLGLGPGALAEPAAALTDRDSDLGTALALAIESLPTIDLGRARPTAGGLL